MKKLVLQISSLLLAGMLTAVIFTNCEKECKTCGGVSPREPSATKELVFDLAGKSLKSKFEIYTGQSDDAYREVASRAPDEQLFQFMKTYCAEKRITLGDQTFAFVLYYDSPISNSLNIKDEQIQGISFYNIEGEKLIHHLYVRDEAAEFQEIENVKVAVSGISANQIEFNLSTHVFTDPKNRSFININGVLFNEVWQNREKYENIHIRYEVQNNEKALSVSKVGTTPYKKECRDNSMCFNFPPGSGEDCKMDNQGKYYCSTTVNCSAQQASTALRGKKEAYFIDMDLMHLFRDNFLYSTQKGISYIDYYYYLSTEFKDKINLSLALQTALFLKEFNPVMKALADNNNRTTAVFSDEMSKSLQDLLTKYEAITKTQRGKEMLNTIRVDAKRFGNKNTEEIRAIFRSTNPLRYSLN
ncbi:hypothetical protein LJC68_04325 [Bacteroidales bacterium OttesenSCG-928-B11]|nr:hypothetical protein [Bacteroidales bacterium OttesenSCG-928-E04]MDL2308808.1 hypothetical protein [Bacteroidales bacterium OttesenSCG-928-C03]MDL2312086.1 hypothetical protein [Bacteroidales bacterium OttesenSCG-928-B11]MDL2325696.1 hypothetical protein [Bacteroidales bacterium OttesenSCG-928-A14]